VPAAFAIGPGYPLRFCKRGLGFVFSSKWVGEKDPVIRCGESGDQFRFFLVCQAWPVNDIGCGLTISSPQILSVPLLAFLKKGEIVKAVSPWYCVAWKTLFIVRSSFQEKDVCYLS